MDHRGDGANWEHREGFVPAVLEDGGGRYKVVRPDEESRFGQGKELERMGVEVVSLLADLDDPKA
jgi:hypothetical protein